MEIDDLTFNSLYSVLQGGMWLLNDIENFLKDYNISHGRFSILLSMKQSGDETLLSAEMARILGKSKPTISNMIKRLEKEGFILCERQEEDSRGKKLLLTEKAEEFLNRVIPLYNERIAEMTSLWNDDDKRELISLISKIQFPDPKKRIKL